MNKAVLFFLLMTALSLRWAGEFTLHGSLCALLAFVSALMAVYCWGRFKD